MASYSDTKKKSVTVQLKDSLKSFGVFVPCAPSSEFSYEAVELKGDAFSVILYFVEKFNPSDFFFKQKLLTDTTTLERLPLSRTSLFGEEILVWSSPRTYYTYRITAVDSEKYYYGVSHVKKENASLEECFLDGYFGSGSKHEKNKFNNWKKKHSTNLVKEVLGIHSSKKAAFAEERVLIGDSWKTDPDCLNSCPGGRVSGVRTKYSSAVTVKPCMAHGESKHQGDWCFKCTIAKSLNLRKCEKHGEVVHQGVLCLTCRARAKNTVKTCLKHGLTLHQGDSCLKCSASKAYSQKNCPDHGVTLHKGKSCVKCSARKGWALQHCEHHGKVLHRGTNCEHCSAQNRVRIRKCELHGMTKHQGSTCARCSSMRGFERAWCEKHEETLHQGRACLACRAEASVRLITCEKHGEVKSIGDRCRTCVNLATVRQKKCQARSYEAPG